MKQGVTITSIAAAILLITAPQVWGASLEITSVGEVEDYFIASDPVCGRVTVVWDEGTQKRFREEPGGGLVTAAPGPDVDINVLGTTCWRLDYGSVDDFDWNVIKEALRLFHRVEVGAVQSCHVVHWMKPIECHSVTATFYARYVRKLFNIRKGDKVALISVLVPGDGVAIVYDDVRVTGRYTECTNLATALLPSATGLCAGVGDTPYFGNGCLASGSKWNFKEQPELDDPLETTTWGHIKAVYK